MLFQKPITTQNTGPRLALSSPGQQPFSLCQTSVLPVASRPANLQPSGC